MADNYNPKKPVWPAVVVLIVFAYAGLCCGRLYGEQIKIETIGDQVREMLLHPFPMQITPWTLPITLALIGVWFVLYLKLAGGGHNLMPGKEYGTADFENPVKLTRKLTDPKMPKFNKIFSEHLKVSLNSHFTGMNVNTTVIGGSGSGKTLFYVLINALQGMTSMVFTDPKSELLNKLGNALKLMGYRVVSLNLIDMKKSDHYNPFKYVRSDNDIIKLVTAIMTNTAPKGSAPSDPFWDNALSLILQALFFYVYYEMPKMGKNASMREVMKLLNMARVSEKEGEKSELDQLMDALDPDHPARVAYQKVKSGAKDTIRSIIISAHARLAFLQNEDVLRILDEDEIDIRSIGEGVYQNPERKTALFCVIPDNDKTYNFLVGVLYTQIFQELYYVADFEHDGSLPIPVAFWMDEFANVALPDGFTEILSTMRSRNISCNIILQNRAQLQTLFKDSWQTIIGNTDVMLYLGCNEPETHKYISEMLGKDTIEKRSTGETLGSHGSNSRNYDVLGRELMTPDEVRKIAKNKCLVFVKGFDPVFDDKCHTFERPEFLLSKMLGSYDGGDPLDDLYETGTHHFYMDGTGDNAEEMSYRYQTEVYHGIFEEAKNFDQVEIYNDQYLLPKKKWGGYTISKEQSKFVIWPVYDRNNTVKIESGGKQLTCHPLVGYLSGDQIILPDEEILLKMFTQNNRDVGERKVTFGRKG